MPPGNAGELRKLGSRSEAAGVELVEGRELLRRQPLIFRSEHGKRCLQPFGQAGRAIVVAHIIKDIGHGKLLVGTCARRDQSPSAAMVGRRALFPERPEIFFVIVSLRKASEFWQ